MHPQRPGSRGLLVRPQGLAQTPPRTGTTQAWHTWTWGLNTALFPSKGGKYLLTEFLVNDLWGMAGGKDAVKRSGKARVSLISTKEKN